MNLSKSDIDLYDFLVEALSPQPGQRRGQAFINAVFCHRRDLVHKIPEKIDPFYDDEKLWSAIEWIKENWHLNKEDPTE